jgi:hypothetical protein
VLFVSSLAVGDGFREGVSPSLLWRKLRRRKAALLICRELVSGLVFGSFAQFGAHHYRKTIGILTIGFSRKVIVLFPRKVIVVSPAK